MRNKFLLLVFIGTANFLFAQKIVVEWGKTRAIRPDFIGTNGNVIGKTNPWDSSEMLNALQKMGVSNIRYPAGTLANYWDWDLGWLDPTVPDSLMINWVAQQGINRSSQRYPLENFAKAIKSTQVEPIYVLNMLTKDLEHSLRGLRKAKALGLPIHLIEMGNELYFNLPLESKVYPSPEDYGKACQLWISAIKKEFPEARCAVLGTELNRNARQKDWTERVLQNAPNADAVIFHVYTGFGLDGGRERNTNNAGQEGLTNATRKFGTPLERQQYELAQLQMPEGYARFLNLAQEVASRYRKMTVPTHMDVWVTEFNVRADSSAIRGTWANLLFIAKFYEEFLEGGQVNLSCFHNIQGPLFAAYFFDTQGLNHVLTEKITTRVGSLSAG
ncbi:hypothetical protein, partial [Runella zeae]|uniref:hypothetical protein n=1 Tax=Runella zeae TaxID=94255 RepID=UPI000561BBA6